LRNALLFPSKEMAKSEYETQMTKFDKTLLINKYNYEVSNTQKIKLIN
jgi:hypothetical protein